jgi:hypothetical protein
MEKVAFPGSRSLQGGMLTAMPFGPTLIIFLFAIYGLANAIAVLKIGQYFIGTSHCSEKDCKKEGHPKETRKGLGRVPYLGDLLYCPPCLAFWFGMAMSHFVVSPAAAGGLVGPWWQGMAIDGLIASGMIWILHLTAERLGHGVDM